MTRYVTRAGFISSPTYDDPCSTNMGSHVDHAFEVFESEAYRDTGLLDASGKTIWATDKAPLGFGRGE